MAVAVEMGEDRHAGLALDAGDEALAAARHHDIDRAIEPLEDLAHRRAVARRHELDRVARQAGGLQPLAQGGGDLGRAAEAVGAGTQDRGIAALEAERARIGGDVGPALEDHRDDAERRRDALEAQAVGLRPFGENPPDRVGQRGDAGDRLGDLVEAPAVEQQTVDEGGVLAAGPRLRQILRIGGEDGVGAAAQRVGHRDQRAVALRFRRERDAARGGAGASSEPLHEGCDIAAGLARRDDAERAVARHVKPAHSHQTKQP